jgi:2-polyprenyl-3-methyl-5-hydroxy-6-metoxy-1,4-benzoquinol methylase
MTVLDAGCGTGTASVAAAHAVTPGGWVLGVDWAAAMVLRARKEAAEAGFTSVGFACEDVTRLRYAPGLFDTVIASMVVPYLTYPQQALANWYGLLRGDGRLAFSWTGSDDPAWQPAVEAVDSFLPAGQRWSDCARRWTVTDAEALLPTGMTASTIIEPLTTHYTDSEHWWQLSWTQASAIAWSQIPPSHRDDAKQAAFAVLADIQGPGGSLERTRTVCYTTARPARSAQMTARRQSRDPWLSARRPRHWRRDSPHCLPRATPRAGTHHDHPNASRRAGSSRQPRSCRPPRKASALLPSQAGHVARPACACEGKKPWPRSALALPRSRWSSI